ncbi:MAG: TIGR00282 family metallophosphoesterase [Lactobacillales bacterium]|jgi:metallophosphoesterase (TIGR00282 family)|nr:TIGR00282 family metallophosphoesterase [Lactobacillales bacterium]
MKILFIGDVVGALGRATLKQHLPALKAEFKPQVVIVNGENSAHGHGITEACYKEILQAGADVVTLGNHCFDNKAVFDFIEGVPKLVRPANLPKNNPGQGACYVKVNDKLLAVVNLLGRTFMNNPCDCPFEVGKAVIEGAREVTPLVFVDFHAETTSDKIAFAHYVDGLASAVIGTHTHVQTNDNRILAGGTAFLTDAGMTGALDGVLGVHPENVINKYIHGYNERFEVLEHGRAQLGGIFIELDDTTGHAKKTQLIRIEDK